MSGHQRATIADTVYFWFAANDTSGSGGDGATPLFDVREAGAAAGAIPLLSGTPTLLTHANYPAGCYEIAVAATVGNGFAADDTFAVYCTLAIDAQNPTGFVGSCTLTPVATQASVDDVPTVAEFNARTILSASYFDPAADTVVNVTNVATLTGHTAQTGDSFARLGSPSGASISVDIADVPTVAEFNARTLLAAGYFDPAADTVVNVTNVATLTGHTVQTGDSFARLGAPVGVSISADIADVPTVAEFNARTLLAGGYFDPATDTVVNVTNVATLTGHTAQTGDSFARLGAPVAASISADIAALNDLAAADILTQVNAALDTAISELGVGAPVATPTIRTGLMLLYMSLRNRTDVFTSGADALRLYNDAGTIITTKLLSDDGSDYSEAEMS